MTCKSMYKIDTCSKPHCPQDTTYRDTDVITSLWMLYKRMRSTEILSSDRHQTSGEKSFSSEPETAMKTIIAAVFLLAITFAVVGLKGADAKNLHKRSFVSLGCMGVYDKSKFARLDRVCEECYQMFRDPDIHSMCRSV